MERFIKKRLIEWKNQSNRKPLIIRGARQVGKTWTISDFGKNCFNGNVHIVNFEKHPEWQKLFDFNLDAKRILIELEIVLNAKIISGNDLLFFDEIQSCPKAIMSLRYFYEEIPELHVVAAGSLIEFAFKDISFPVGRVQFLNMHPLSFSEFLIAQGKDKLAETILEPPRKQPEIIHISLLNEIRNYMFVGGMPECVNYYKDNGHFQDVFEIQLNLLSTYRLDFSKYAPYSDKRCLNSVLTSVAKGIGKQIKYTHLAEGFSIPTIKRAFELLIMAQLISKIESVNPSGLPIDATTTGRKFKALMTDIGMMQQICNIPADVEYHKTDLLSIYQGAMAEQFVGQEFTVAGQNELYYWSRDEKSSSAEVDFLITVNNQIIPVEVKSNASGSLKSLHLLLDAYKNCKTGYVFSCREYSELPEQKLVFLPLYYAYGVLNRVNGTI